MSATYVFAVEGLDAITSIEALPAEVLTAARQAVNKTTERARALGARRIREQVAFLARYLSGEDARLKITKRAQGLSLTGVVAGRSRPTSLARFATSGRVGRRGGVRVQVKPGSARAMPGAFLMRLKSGKSFSDSSFNLGLAVRTKGGKPKTAYKPFRITDKLWLLYGPSVDQVFRSVAPEIAPAMGDFLEDEFNRLLDLRK